VGKSGPGTNRLATGAAATFAGNGKAAPTVNWNEVPDNTWAATNAWLTDGNYDNYNHNQVTMLGGRRMTGSQAKGYVPTGHVQELRGTHRDYINPADSARQAGSVTLASAKQVQDTFDHMAKTNPTRFAALQSLLQSAGLYGATIKPLSGVWTADDGDAMARAIESSHRAGIPLETYLVQRAAAVKAAGAAATGAPLVIQHTDPTKITGALNSNSGGIGTSVAAQTIGRNLTPDELQQYINKIHAGETTAQTAAYNLHRNDPSYAGTVDPSAGAANANDAFNKAEPINAATLKAALEAEHPAEAAAQKFGDAGAAIRAMLDQHMQGATAT